MSLHMTPKVTVIGSFIAFMGVVSLVVFFPALEDPGQPSEIWRPRTTTEEEGRQIYIADGCQYCHSQYIRAQDWDYGDNRVSQAGDYHLDTPPLLGSERQGPDLSQEGGLRSDDWHVAHFNNPRYTRPDSIMPPFHWLGNEEIPKLIAYVQSLGGTNADKRMQRQRFWKNKALEAYDAGPVKNMEWLHAHVPQQWMDLPNPYPTDEASLKRGEDIYQHFCIGCHGPVGDGMGPAARFLKPVPFNFTHLKNWEGNIGGMFYYQIMNGITGTAMPPFKTELESEKIWDVGNYIALTFVGRPRETENMERSIPSSFEEPRFDEEGVIKEDKNAKNEEGGDK